MWGGLQQKPGREPATPWLCGISVRFLPKDKFKK